MSKVEEKVLSKDEQLLKDIVIEAFNKWCAENPSARNAKTTAERLPNISNTTFTRIIEAKTLRGVTLDEAIEILTLTNHLELLNRYMTQSTSDNANYLRMLKNKTGEQIKVDLSSTDPVVLMNAINEGFAHTKAELRNKEIIIQRALGIFIGSLITGFLFFYYSNFAYMNKYLWGN